MTGRLFAKDSELVLGLVAPVGVDLDAVKQDLKNYFEQVRYDFNFLHLSDIANDFEKV